MMLADQYYKSFSGPNTPDWLIGIALIVAFSVLVILLIKGAILEIRSLGPYTLANLSSKEKWVRAFKIALYQSSFVPIVGLIAPFLSPLPDQWLFIPYCFGAWPIFLLLFTLSKRWQMDWNLNNFEKISKWLKSEKTPSFLLKIFGIMSFNKELQKFFHEGYSDDDKKPDNTH